MAATLKLLLLKLRQLCRSIAISRLNDLNVGA